MRKTVAATVVFSLAVHLARAQVPGVPPARPPSAAAPPRPAAQPALARIVRGPTKSKPPAAPPTPSAPVSLALEAPSTRGPWTLRVTNNGAIPLALVADVRHLILDVTPRSAEHPVRCALPDDMRPADPLERTVVLGGHTAFVESFEPRLYCFDGKALEALASGSIVVAKLGWDAPAAKGGPFEVSPLDGVQPELSSRKFLEAPPIALPDEATPLAPPVVIGGVPLGTPRVSISAPPTVDAESPDGLTIPLTLRNEGSRPVLVRFRPEMLRFELARPTGTDRCSWPTLPAAPTREAFSLIPAFGATDLAVELGAFCAGRSLDRGGLFTIRPILDTRKAGGASLGLRAFEGEVSAREPTFVRLHRGRAAAPLVRPKVENSE